MPNDPASAPARPSQEDAKLILRLYELRREPRMRQARAWFAASFRAATMEEFARLCPPGSEENASFRMVAGYWDMAASFVANGLLHEELFFESNRELLLVWERIRELLPHSRAANKNPISFRSLERVGQRYIAWLSALAPEHYPVFAANVRAMAGIAAPPQQPEESTR